MKICLNTYVWIHVLQNICFHKPSIQISQSRETDDKTCQLMVIDIKKYTEIKFMCFYTKQMEDE